MYRAFACLTEEHTGWVVALAASVCWISCAVALKLEQRVQVRADRHGPIWLLASGFSIGAGIWSTHFIGMLGYDPGVVLGYEPRTTLLSLIVAIAAASAAFLFARAAPSRWAGAAAGLVLGIGIACMHFLGIAGCGCRGTSPGTRSWRSRRSRRAACSRPPGWPSMSGARAGGPGSPPRPS
ncbi:MHYT domain-containing protein [Methylobacterium oryzae CBMB20]